MFHFTVVVSLYMKQKKPKKNISSFTALLL